MSDTVISRSKALADVSEAIAKAYASGATTEEIAQRLAWEIVRDAMRSVGGANHE